MLREELGEVTYYTVYFFNGILVVSPISLNLTDVQSFISQFSARSYETDCTLGSIVVAKGEVILLYRVFFLTVYLLYLREYSCCLGRSYLIIPCIFWTVPTATCVLCTMG